MTNCDDVLFTHEECVEQIAMNNNISYEDAEKLLADSIGDVDKLPF